MSDFATPYRRRIRGRGFAAATAAQDQLHTWFRTDKLSFEERLTEWVVRSSSVNEFLERSHLDVIGFTPHDLQQLRVGTLRPTRHLAWYLSSLVPVDFSTAAFRHTGEEAASEKGQNGNGIARRDVPQIHFDRDQWHQVRLVHLNQLLDAQRQHEATTDPVVDFLAARIQEIAERFNKANELDMAASLRNIASLVGLDTAQLLGTAPFPTEKIPTISKLLAGVLELDDDEYATLLRLANQSWKGRTEHAAMHAVARTSTVIRFLRLSRGMSQRELARRLGITQASISGFEVGKWTPLNQLDALIDVLELTTTEQSRLKPLFAEARNELSAAPSFGHVLERAIGSRTNEEFLAYTGLEGFLTSTDIDNLRSGIAAPSDNVANCLRFFLPRGTVQAQEWQLSIRNAQALISNTCDFSHDSEHGFRAFRSATIERLASEDGNAIQRAAHVVRFLRLSEGMSQVGLARRLGIDRTDIERWETGTKSPFNQLDVLVDIFTLTTTEQSRLKQLVAEARSELSTAPPFVHVLERAIGSRTNEEFLAHTGLEGFLTGTDIDNLRSGVAAPSDHVANTLAFFFPLTPVQSNLWQLSIRNAQALVPDTCDFSDESNSGFQAFRSATIERLANEDSGAIQRAAHVVRFLRVSEGMSQAGLARRLGITRNAVDHWENAAGTPHRYLDRLCDVFSLTAKDRDHLSSVFVVGKTRIRPPPPLFLPITQILDQAMGGRDSTQFLDETGLQDFLSEQDVNGLRDGLRTPSRRLIDCLAALVPRESFDLSLWRQAVRSASTLSAPICDFANDAEFRRFRMQTAERLTTSQNPRNERAGQLVRFVRISAGLEQATTGKRLAVPPSKLAAWETGRESPRQHVEALLHECDLEEAQLVIESAFEGITISLTPAGLG